MPFQVSPGVVTSEIDLTTIVPSVSTTEGAIAGVFHWGPVEQKHLVSTEDELRFRYGAPSDSNFETWFTGANFLAYGNKLYVSRAASNSYNAKAGSGYTNATSSTLVVKNDEDYLTQTSTIHESSTTDYVAKYPGELGNSLRISVCDSANAYRSSIVSGSATNEIGFTFTVGSNSATLYVTNYNDVVSAANTLAQDVYADLSVGDYLIAGNTTIGTQAVQIKAMGSIAAVNASTVQATLTLGGPVTLSSNVTQMSNTVSGVAITRYWEFANLIDAAPGTSDFVAGLGGGADELHVVVVDDEGKFSGVRGAVLEVWDNLSRATDATGAQGGSTYYKNVINNSSKYVWWAKDRSGAASNTAANIVASTNETPLNYKFYGGTNGYTETTIPIMSLAKAYDVFRSAEDTDVSLILQGKARGELNGAQLANYLIDNLAEYRKDCVVFISPRREDVVSVALGAEDNIVTFKNSVRDSSYGFMDSGYKYQYDKYNDVFRWVPLNGDIAGLAVRTDDLRDPWWSPAGFNRGQIKNIIKLAFNPDKARRDVLYKAGVNPVVTFIGQGTVLYGDKTCLKKPSAFDRINVRRLFIVLEKAIATAAKYTLFEFNDEFTRAQFRNLVEPYLRDVQGRRGVTDFKVVCNDSNNTPEIIDRNEFVGDIYIKPARSINFIQLNFVAVRTGVSFEEIVGKF